MILSFLLYLWQLPQSLIGLIFSLLSSPDRHTFNMHKHKWTEASLNYTGWMERGGLGYGVSLGKYIFLYQPKHNGDLTSERHEYGHCMQSLYLGPLYLFVIGIPSLIHAIIGKGDYYKFYTERWADKLGGVKR